jgi:hypothetical protein
MDAKAGSLDNMFDFGHPGPGHGPGSGRHGDKLLLDPTTGEPAHT